MLLLLSPAKSLNFAISIHARNLTVPEFVDDTRNILAELKKLKPQEISQLMKISDKLATLNYQRFQEFQFPLTEKNSKPALFVFDGDVYDAFDVEKYSTQDLQFAQKHLRILSGLYGILRPLDLMQAYRLEMSTNFKVGKNKNLYEFWQEKLTNYLNDEIKTHREKIILNLASEEYFSSVNPQKINAKIINIIFKEKKGSEYKIIGLFAKKARGMMADYIIKNRIDEVEKIKKFSLTNYKFQPKLSDEFNWCFCR